MVRDRGRVFGVFLAAGRSRRMGRPKLELPFREGTLGSTALAAACGSALDGIFVITGDTAAPAWLPGNGTEGPDRSRVHRIPCKDAEHGQAFSLRCGVEAALRHGAEAVVVLLADQPLLTSSAINRLLDEYHGLSDEKGRPAFIAASRAGEGVPQPPVLLDSVLFPELMRLTGDAGARRLLRGSFAEQGKIIRFPETELFLDIDTPESYDDLLQRTALSGDEGENRRKT